MNFAFKTITKQTTKTMDPATPGQLAAQILPDNASSTALTSSSRTSLTPMATRCLERYGTATNLLATFNADRQQEYTRDIVRALRGNAPSLGTIAIAYGRDIPKAWIVPQLVDLCNYTGCPGKLNRFQLNSLAGVIQHNWGHLKLTELMLFFQMFKSGKFGRFYGTVDGLIITEALQEFSRWRLRRITEIEREEQRRQRQEDDRARASIVRAYADLCRRAGMSQMQFARFIQDLGIPADENAVTLARTLHLAEATIQALTICADALNSLSS